jgi:hypothetical protein
MPSPLNDEARFQDAYRRIALGLGLNPNPDDPAHQYDWRGWFRAYQANPARFGPQPDPSDGRLHFPSEFKTADHPNRFVRASGLLGDFTEDSRTGAVAPLVVAPSPRPVNLLGVSQPGADENRLVALLQQMSPKR